MPRTGPTNQYLETLVADLKKKAREENAPIWRTLAKKLEKPSRQRVEVNLSDIGRHAKDKETVVVPGVVLSNGDLEKPVTVAAWRFSQGAAKKIAESKSKMMTIEELMAANPKGGNVRIMV